MLKFLAGKKRSRNIFLLVFVGILTISLIGLFGVVVSGGAAGLFRSSTGDDAVVAKVASLDVTAKELRDALSAFSQQMAQGRGTATRDSLGMTYSLYGQQVMDNLIRNKLIIYEADKLNLGASDSEVLSHLKQIFSPWNPDQYRARLQQAGMSPISFEDNIRASIAQEHLRSYISAAVQVSQQEIEDDYKRANTQYTVRWVALNPEQLRSKVPVNDNDLRAYFDSHKGDFKINTEQRRARYIFVDQSRAGETIQINDDELKAKFKPEDHVNQVRVSQIVLNVPAAQPAKTGESEAKPADNGSAEETIRTKAQDLIKRAQGAEGKPAEDFAQLARENSDDSRTKANGGDIGWVNKKDKRGSDDPISHAFGIKKGDVTQQPIKKGDKFYILKVTDVKIPTFAELKEDLLKEQRNTQSYSKAVTIASEVEQQFKETKNADAVSAEINKKYGTAITAIKQTPFFNQGDKLPDLGVATEFEGAVFELQNINDVTQRMNVEKGFAIGQYIEKKDPHDATFEEVKSKAEDRYRIEKSKDLALAQAKQVAQANTADELKKIAGSIGAKADERAGLSASDSIGPLTSDADRAPVYKLKLGEVTHEPIKTENGENYVVAAMVARKDADMGEAFQKERKSIEQRLLDDKRNIYFQTYLAETERRMKDSGKIKIYDDTIQDVLETGGGPAGAPAGAPGRPRTRRGPRK